MGICYRSIFSALFEKNRITEFVSCFIGSLVVKVTEYRFAAPREGCFQDGCACVPDQIWTYSSLW